MIDSADLVGIEIGLKSVSAIVLSSDASSIVRFAETEITTSPDEIADFPDIAEPLQKLWRELGLDLSSLVRAAVAVSHTHAGIGSGPSIESWIDSLGGDLGTTLIRVGERFEGVSYLPQEVLESIRSGFEPLGIQPDRIELAPISAARCFAPKSTYSFAVESGVSWQARVHSGLILEAMVAEEPSASTGLSVLKGPDAGQVSTIHGLDLSAELMASLRITVSDIAVVAGAARGLVERPVGNLLTGTEGKPVTVQPQQTPAPQQPAASTQQTSNVAQLPQQQQVATNVAPTTTPTPVVSPIPTPSPAPAATSAAADSPDFKPLPPQHITTMGQSTATDPAPADVRPTPNSLEPGQQRAGFEPGEEEVANSTAESPAVTPAFLPPSGTITNTTPDIEPSAEPRSTSTLNPAGRKRTRRSQENRSNRPSTIEAQRPKIDRHEDEFPSEPFEGKTQKTSTYNLKLLTGALSVLIIVGLIIFFFGPT